MLALKMLGLKMTRPPLLHFDDWRTQMHGHVTQPTTEDEVAYRAYLRDESGMAPITEVLHG